MNLTTCLKFYYNAIIILFYFYECGQAGREGGDTGFQFGFSWWSNGKQYEKLDAC